jgi:cytochrome c oxidase subunit IV
MAGVSYEEGKKQAYRGFVLLGIITIAEVIIALFGNGHIVEGFELPKFVMYPIMIVMSLYKAYFIVNEFMHMKYEVRGLAMSVILPCILLIWAIIAFLQEGNSWGERRELIKDKNSIEAKPVKQTGALIDAKSLNNEVELF